MKIFILFLFAVVVVTSVAGKRKHSSKGDSSEGNSSEEGFSFHGLHLGKKPKPSATIPTTTSKTPSASQASVETESRTLDAIYAAALAEGGKLIVYAGGDTIGQQDSTKQAFEARFPGMTLDMIVDLSKFHDGRIDNQLATNTLIPDVVQLQTLQDFPRWKSLGVLKNYKPLGWEHVYPEFRDADAAFTGIHIHQFGMVINKRLIPNEADWPKLATDLLRSDLKSEMIGTYPHDDDAVLFWYKQMIDKYGWEFISQLAKQNVTFVRGTAASGAGVASGQFAVSIGTGGRVVNSNTSDSFMPLEPETFVSWAQRAAIFKNASHPEAAKLYLSWTLDPATQATRFTVRDDVPTSTNRTIWEYKNTNPLAFIDFMSDRSKVEQLKTQMALYFGEVQGDSPTGYPGLHPTEALPH